MKKIPLDERTLAVLRDVKQRAEICDEEGRIVGYFEPSKFAGMFIPEFDEAELNRRAKDPGGMTTAQLVEHLRSLEQK